ncbi:hypothetical protein ACPPVS_03960 [Cellulomonas sp. McL0617]|uniref:hypothetical protein n=1 Tax=Cellulomonas sp. McL0617 TaxID=3415675 RepID=UPI003CEE0200
MAARCETAAKWIYESSGDGAANRALRYDDAMAVLSSPGVRYGDWQTANDRRGALINEQERFRRGEARRRFAITGHAVRARAARERAC